MQKRRSFLRQSAALGLAALGPAASAMPSATATGETVGHGDFRYRVDQKWGDLDPRRHNVQHCHEMVMDSRGRLICSSVSLGHDVLVYSKDGKLLDAWKHDLPEPHGMTLAGEGEDQTFWITDTITGAVVNLDLAGRVIRQLDPPPKDLLAGKPYKPTETTVTTDGDIYVADGYGSNLIFRYDSKGRLRDSFGGSDHFDCCHGIAVDYRTDQPTLLITSRAANAFQRWTLDGRHLMTYNLPGLSICRPVIDGDHTYFAVIVTKSWYNYDGMLAVLDKDMRVVSLPGGSEPPASQRDFHTVEYDNQTFLNPHDVCLDEDKNLYVPQWFSGRTYPIRLKRV
ncbi:6-bladed beta-propeller [Lewinella sp. JB7]|uniref:6-bladed beta-propeller n=1 Tax=Lewinella sp. JB7 TaxID=2962887 RepID=UPI0020C9B386|nr:6-bladed beta-propeller [Lewinella sp. JB7]MCP9237777.1 6-bladed beta-propeller [Lewinella sp. JB7]